MRKKILGVLLGAAVCATPAFAYDNHRSINDIEHREQLRIDRHMRALGGMGRPQTRLASAGMIPEET